MYAHLQQNHPRDIAPDAASLKTAMPVLRDFVCCLLTKTGNQQIQTICLDSHCLRVESGVKSCQARDARHILPGKERPQHAPLTWRACANHSEPFCWLPGIPRRLSRTPARIQARGPPTSVLRCLAFEADVLVQTPCSVVPGIPARTASASMCH